MDSFIPSHTWTPRAGLLHPTTCMDAASRPTHLITCMDAASRSTSSHHTYGGRESATSSHSHHIYGRHEPAYFLPSLGRTPQAGLLHPITFMDAAIRTSSFHHMYGRREPDYFIPLHVWTPQAGLLPHITCMDAASPPTSSHHMYERRELAYFTPHIYGRHEPANFILSHVQYVAASRTTSSLVRTSNTSNYAGPVEQSC
jgi:hypothetical protein